MREEIKNSGVVIHNATGHNMEVRGVFMITFAILGREITAPMVVTDNLCREAILGMNIMEQEGLLYDPISKQCRFSTATPPETGWTCAGIQLQEEVTVQPLQARLVRCVLKKQNGERLGANTNFYGDIQGLPVAGVTDQHGAAKLYLTNPGMEELLVPSRTFLGTAEEEGLFVAVPLDEDTITEIFTSMRTPGSTAPVKTTKGKPLMWPQNVSDKMKCLITERIAETVGKEWFPAYFKLLVAYADIISEDATDLGFTDTVVHDIKLRDTEPVYTKQFPLAVDEYDLLRNNVRDWLKIGIIEPAQSLYNSPLFCVKKKEGQGLRVVLDYRKLNAKTLPDRYSIRGVDECIREVGNSGSTIFSTLDLTAGFWQMKLNPEVRPYTAFTVPGMGQFQWITSPMGLTGCPASFARLMDIVMRDVPNVITYIDDVLVHSCDKEIHLDDLRGAFERLRDNNLKLNLRKCHFATDSVAYLGHQLTKDGVKPGIDKTNALLQAAPPTTVKEVQSFLGLANYFRGYIKGFAIVASPLYALTKQNSEWKGGPMPTEAMKAFKYLQGVMSTGPILQYSRKNGKYHLYVDSATGRFDGEGHEGGLGAVLLQENRDGTKGVIGYASRRLQTHEQNYSAYLLEMQAAIYGMEHFEAYLKNRSFILYTDHKPLIRLSPVHMKTLNRLEEKMTQFFFEMRHVDGKDNTIADYLSRTAGDGCAAISEEESKETYARLQHADPELLQWIKAYKGDNTVPETDLHPLFTRMGLRHNVLYLQVAGRKGFMDKGAYRVIVPTTLRHRFLKEAHDSLIGGHGGFFKTAERLKAVYWWPNMDHDIEKHVSQCTVCQRATNKGRLPNAPLHPIPLARKPNDRVHIDLMGPLEDEDEHKKYICVMTDAFTKIVRLSIVASKTAEEVGKSILDNWVFIYGVPKEVITDQGLEFNNTLAYAMWHGLGVNHHTTTPYHPQTNGQAEVFNKTMKAYLTKVRIQAKEDTIHWSKYIGPLMFSHNTAVHKATLMTPFYAMFGYDPRCQEWPEGRVLDFDNEDQTGNPLADLRRAQDIARSTAKHNNQHAQEQMKEQYDKTHKVKLTKLVPGQLVWVQLHATNEKNKKLADKWEEGEVVEQTTLETWKVCRSQRKRRRYATINVYHLKPRDAEREAEEEAEETPIPPMPTPMPTQTERQARRRRQRERSPTPDVDHSSQEEDSDNEEEDDSDTEDYQPTSHHARKARTAGPSTHATRSKAKLMLQAVSAVLAVSEEIGDDENVLEWLIRLLTTTNERGEPRTLRQLWRQAAPMGQAGPQQPQQGPPPVPPFQGGPRPRRTPLQRELAKLQPHNPDGTAEQMGPLPERRTRRATSRPREIRGLRKVDNKTIDKKGHKNGEVQIPEGERDQIVRSLREGSVSRYAVQLPDMTGEGSVSRYAVPLQDTSGGLATTQPDNGGQQQQQPEQQPATTNSWLPRIW